MKNQQNHWHHKQGTALRSMRGVTIVSLMVTLIIGLIVSMAALSTLTVTRVSYNTVDTASQMQDNARLASQMIQRLASQAGFKDLYYAAQPNGPTDVGGNIAPNVMGFNNAAPLINANTGEVTPSTSSAVFGGSDTLILRYQPAENNRAPGTSDKTVIDCLGSPIDLAATSRSEKRSASIFYVALATDRQPNLKCVRIGTDGTVSDAWSLIEGVETFQVLYGVDATTADPNSQFTGPKDSTAHRYLYASQFDVPGNRAATYSNWRRVRSLRIGLVLRGPPNSQALRQTETLYPLGQNMSSAADPQSVFTTPNPADGRLRKAFTFTVHLRNDQDSALSP